MNKKKRILIFSPSYPPRIGGLESHADEFNKHITQKSNVSITVLTPKIPDSAPQKEILHGDAVTIFRFPAFFIIPNYPVPKIWKISFWRILHQVYKNDHDLIVSRIRFFITSFIALIYAKCTRKPLIHIEHCSDFVQMSSAFKNVIARIYDYTLGRAVLAFSTKNIANSQKTADFCSKLYKKSHCTVIHRGVEIERIRNIPCNSVLKDAFRNKVIITFIGRLIDGKGVHDLLSAAKDIEKDFVIFIVGDGPQKNNLHNMVREYKMEKRVVFHGFKKQKDAIGIMKASDIIVSPSYTEGLPTSIVEAALCKKAIIATTVGGTTEIITGAQDSILIEPRDPLNLKKALITFIDNQDLRERYGKNAFDRVKNKFSWNRATSHYTDIFKQILNT